MLNRGLKSGSYKTCWATNGVSASQPHIQRTVLPELFGVVHHSAGREARHCGRTAGERRLDDATIVWPSLVDIQLGV